ncbi:endodeoxyribonuclease RusA [Sinirhodobacter populi]|uniref:Endodeoxyribonuclease RusA n=1 Tax=Paenirhodobacter populi TaxID=2306993 RepID=A0A443K7W7_9RHOB|nr:endodeoxyribonuclease RusA [Sinirhodobacter populi]RWR28820.1 endodeoxyribonuclease RusA [Sinirhodobacter populi]
MTRITLPFPYNGLSPNDRHKHWSEKARAVKRYRRDCAAFAMERGAHKLSGPFRLSVTFCPKSRGPLPDMDNLVASFKAGQDGLADVLHVNDRDLAVTYAIGERCKDGGVIVDIHQNEAARDGVDAPAAGLTETTVRSNGMALIQPITGKAGEQ